MTTSLSPNAFLAPRYWTELPPISKLRTLRLLLLATATACCLGACTPSMKGPDRLVPVDVEMQDIRNLLTPANAERAKTSKTERNNLITARKYAIDVQYSEYEASIIREAELSDFGTKVATIGLTQAASVIPVAHTARLLAQISTGVDGIGSAYNEKILRAQLIQNILASMRIARHNQAAVIYANMYCSESDYTLPMAFSDLELYYRAGTVPTGIVKLTQTVAKAETIAQANENVQKPASAQSQAILQGAAAEADGKANPSSDMSCKNGPRPGLELMRLNSKIIGLENQLRSLKPAPAPGGTPPATPSR